MKRYEFLRNFAFGGSLLLAVPAVFTSCEKDDSEPSNLPGPGNDLTVDLEAAAFASLKSIGGFAYQGDIIIIRSGENQYMAFSKLCTHSNCEVRYDHAKGNLPCPCHGSVFATSGAVLEGPANRALKKYTVTISGTKVTIN
jgi:cytochrome b6-f complex iron-sulfur subunit